MSDRIKIMHPLSSFRILLCAFVALSSPYLYAQETERPVRTLIVIFDGLRPDYITPENMPNLYDLKKNGSYARHNHSVFPTVTRVNASSYATGTYPAKHGILGNTVYFPEVDKTKGLNTGDFKELVRIAEATCGKLLTAVSLGELLQQSGSSMMVFSSGSSGQAFLQNHTISGGGVVNPEVILPAGLREDLIKSIGPAPASAKPNLAQHEWATRALLKYGLAPGGPDVNAIWFSDPDGTAHSEGIGSSLAMQSIKMVDQQLGDILEFLNERDLKNYFNIIVTADHGFVTDVGTEGLSAFLIREGLKDNTSSEDVILSGNAVYVRDHNASVIGKIVSVLQEQPWVGAIFTRSKPGQSAQGWVEGTLSFEAIHWDHATRAADILVDYNWDNRKNAYGYEGTSLSPGVAGHGGSSPYEIHIPLIASGPAFKKRFESSLPTSNIDILPTVVHLHGLALPPNIDGRVLTEILEGSRAGANSEKKEVLESVANHPWGTYTLILERSVVGNQRYVNFTRVKRQRKQ
jgi:hypothetical protein